MKKTLFIVFTLSFLLTSCDFMLKDHSKEDVTNSGDDKVVLGADKDENGCVASAGYMWSELRKNCIRVFEEGYRLAPFNNQAEANEEDNEQETLNAYVIFNEDKDTAELFLPNEKESVLLENEGTTYGKGEWKLETSKGYVLKKGNEIQYVSAIAQEKKFVGSDQAEQ
ncbi:hypothetical protein ABGT15_06395 [Flavobacterium enshiense]|uniref:hypothetical protein n=1 Tax=Flavobacterium enshiense TaxID=1341165 RepID=UPI00345C7B86